MCLLEDRAPAWLVDPADLPRPAPKTGTGERSTIGRDRRRQALRRVQPLDVVPVELEADQPARRAAGLALALERAPADEVGLVEVDQPARGRSRTGE